MAGFQNPFTNGGVFFNTDPRQPANHEQVETKQRNSFFSDLGDKLGLGDNSAFTNAVQGPTQDAYQIGGLGDYQNQLRGFMGQAPGAPDLSGATQGSIGTQQALTQYLMGVANGTQNTAADAMFQNGMAQNARQAQSAAVSAGGMNPALAMRQILGAQSAGAGNITGQAAQQKLQQQMMGAQAAGQSNQALYNMQFQNAQQQFQDQQAAINQQSNLAKNIFESNQAQTAYNVQFQQNQTAFQQWKESQQEANKARIATAVQRYLGMALNTTSAIVGGVSAQNSTNQSATTGGASDPGMMNGGGAMGGSVT